jgi:DNA-binding protein YbaB
LKLYKQLIKEKGMSIEQVVNIVDIAIHKLPYIDNLYGQAKDEAEKMQRTIQRLANDITALEYKISILDKTAFSCEQECKRTEQRVQELADKKDILEKLIANILNGEGYSKVKQFIKENVKAVLSENKELISISFAAVIQTLKADPQMVKLIQNVPGANDGEQYKDNNITKYLESNKDRILNLGEKNYENLVEVFTNSAIFEAADSLSSWSNNTLPSSSPELPSTYDQSDL